MLIHEGAYSIASQENLLALLHLSPQKSEEATASLFSSVQLTENEKLIISILREPTDKDTLFQKTSLSFPDFLTAFSSLEINGYIEESFGEVRRIV